MSFMREGDYEIGMWGQAHTYDPDLSALLSRTGASNHARYSNEDMARLLTEGTETVVAEDRYPIYEEVQQIFKEDAPIIHRSKERRVGKSPNTWLHTRACKQQP